MRLNRGFSLMEMLTTVAAVAILAAIVVPLSSKLFVYTRRLEAENALSQLAVAMERYQATYNTYRGATLATLQQPEYSVHGAYRMMIQHAGDGSYVLVATPRGYQAQHDTKCAALTLNQNGEKGVTGPAKVEECV